MNFAGVLFNLLRTKQYIKNIFIFLPAIFAASFSINIFENLLVLFLIISLAASSIYIFNDIVDIEEDRKDIKKRNRAIASGLIKKNTAAFISFFLANISLSMALYFFNQIIFSLIFLYLAINVAYSLKLKHIAIYDITIVAIGFVIRVAAGGYVCNITPSPWLYSIVFSSTLFLAASKRRRDVLNLANGVQTRIVAKEYSLNTINSIMIIMGASTIGSYIIYAIEKSSEIDYFFVTSLFVIIGILKYIQLAFKNECGDDPSYDAIQNKDISILLVLWFSLIMFLILR